MYQRGPWEHSAVSGALSRGRREHDCICVSAEKVLSLPGPQNPQGALPKLLPCLHDSSGGFASQGTPARRSRLPAREEQTRADGRSAQSQSRTGHKARPLGIRLCSRRCCEGRQDGGESEHRVMNCPCGNPIPFDRNSFCSGPCCRKGQRANSVLWRKRKVRRRLVRLLQEVDERIAEVMPLVSAVARRIHEEEATDIERSSQTGRATGS